MSKEATGKRHRIPKLIRLPFNYTIRIVQQPPGEIEKEMGTECYGYWMDHERTIYLSNTLTAGKKRWILVHELQHALNDYQLYCAEIGLVKP